jgi:hypothetical protein
LIAILIGLAALLILAGVSVIFRRSPAELPANTPGGTVQRFYNAITQEDYDAAYLLLSDSMVDKPTRDRFVEYNITQRAYYGDRESQGVRVESEVIRDNTAFVTLEITSYYVNSGPFGGSGQWTNTETFTLRNEGDIWRITELPYNYMPYIYR